MIGLPFVYGLLGLMFAGVAVVTARDADNPRRWRTAGFWALMAAAFLAGDLMGPLAAGGLVLVLAALATTGLGRSPLAPPPATTRGAGAALFLPALAVPVVALLGSLWLKGVEVGGRPLVDPKQVTGVSLALGVAVAMAMLWPLVRPRAADPLRAAEGLFNQIGWAAVLPQALAALGAVFAAAGVGRAVGTLFAEHLPLATPGAAVCAYTLGMAAFTIAMGNAFAAFPVMTAAIGLPLLIGRFHGDPAVVGALGMLSGFCGTLVSPLAANFNLVPVALLDLPDRWVVIRVQAPTAAALLIVNTALLYLLAFPR